MAFALKDTKINKKSLNFHRIIQCQQRNIKMQRQQQIQISTFILTIKSVSVAAKFPCKIYLQHLSNILTPQIQQSSEAGKYIFNREIAVEWEVLLGKFQIIVNLVTEKGAKYLGGIIELHPEELMRQQGQTLIVNLNKAIDQNAICQLRVDQITSEKVVRKFSVDFEKMEMEENQKHQQRGDNDFELSPKDNYSPQRNHRTKSQFQYKLNNRKFINNDADEQGRFTNIQKNRSPGYNSQRYNPKTNRYEFRSQKQMDGLYLDNQNRNKLIDAQIYKESYNKLKEKYRRESQTAKNQHHRRLSLQSNENTYKLELLRLKLRLEENQKTIGQKNKKIKQLQQKIANFHHKDTNINYYLEELKAKQSSISVLQDTILSLNRQLQQQKEAEEQITNSLILKLKESQQEYHLAYLKHQEELEDQASKFCRLQQKFDKQQIQLKYKIQRVQKQQKVIDELETNAHMRIVQFQVRVDQIKSEYITKIRQLQAKITDLQDQLITRQIDLQKFDEANKQQMVQLQQQANKTAELEKLLENQRIKMQQAQKQYQNTKEQLNERNMHIKNIENQFQMNQKQLIQKLDINQIEMVKIKQENQKINKLLQEKQQQAKQFKNRLKKSELLIQTTRKQAQKIQATNLKLKEQLKKTKKQSELSIQSLNQKIQIQQNLYEKKMADAKQMYAKQLSNINKKADLINEELVSSRNVFSQKQENLQKKIESITKENSKLFHKLQLLQLQNQQNQKYSSQELLNIKRQLQKKCEKINQNYQLQKQLKNIIQDYERQMRQKNRQIINLKNQSEWTGKKLTDQANRQIEQLNIKNSQLQKQLKSLKQAKIITDNNFKTQQDKNTQVIKNLESQKKQNIQNIRELTKNHAQKVKQLQQQLCQLKVQLKQIETKNSIDNDQRARLSSQLTTATNQVTKMEQRQKYIKKQANQIFDEICQFMQEVLGMENKNPIMLKIQKYMKEGQGQAHNSQHFIFSPKALDKLNNSLLSMRNTFQELETTIMHKDKKLEQSLKTNQQLQVNLVEFQKKSKEAVQKLHTSNRQSNQKLKKSLEKTLQQRYDDQIFILQQQNEQIRDQLDQKKFMNDSLNDELTKVNIKKRELQQFYERREKQAQKEKKSMLAQLQSLTQKINNQEKKNSLNMDKIQSIKFIIEEKDHKIADLEAKIHHQEENRNHLENQLNILKHQNKTYQVQTEALQHYLGIQKQEVKTLSSKQKQVVATIQKLKAEKTQKIKQCLALTSKVAQFETNFVAKQNSIQQLNENYKKIQDELKFLKSEHKKKQSANQQRLQEIISENQSEISRLKSHNHNIEIKLKEEVSNLKQKQLQNSELKSLLIQNKTRNQQVIEQYLQQNKKLYWQIQDIKNQIKKQGQKSQQMHKQLQRTKKQLQEKSEQLDNLNSIKHRKSTEIQEIQKELNHQLSLTKYLQSVVKQYQIQFQRKQKEFEQLKQKYFTLENIFYAKQEQHRHQLQQIRQQYDAKINYQQREQLQKQYLIQNDKNYFQMKLKELEHQKNQKIEQYKLSQQSNEKLLRSFEQKLVTSEQQRHRQILQKNQQIKKINIELKDLLNLLKSKENTISKLEKDLVLAKNIIGALQNYKKDTEQKIRSINLFYQQELENLKIKKESVSKNYKQIFKKLHWDLEREFKAVMQAYISRNIIACSTNSKKDSPANQKQFLQQAKNMEEELISILTRKLGAKKGLLSSEVSSESGFGSS